LSCPSQVIRARVSIVNSTGFDQHWIYMDERVAIHELDILGRVIHQRREPGQSPGRAALIFGRAALSAEPVPVGNWCRPGRQALEAAYLASRCRQPPASTFRVGFRQTIDVKSCQIAVVAFRRRRIRGWTGAEDADLEWLSHSHCG
jgi:hypothetical protein